MIGFIGLSHLGIVYSLATAARGIDVLAFDPDAGLCDELGHARFPIAEPGLRELFQAHRSRIRFSSRAEELGQCELVFVSQDVSTDQTNRSDLAPLQKLIESVAGHFARTATVVVLCQAPPGFTRSLKVGFAGQPVGWRWFYQVETLIFGNAVERALHPERIIIGCDDPKAALPGPYTAWLKAFGCPLLPMRYESAELAKIAINLFLVSSVSTTNTLAELCEKIGADWSEIAPALRLDKRIGPHAYLTPGLGIAGGNLERDLMTVKRLAEGSEAEAGIVEAWLHNSLHRRDWATQSLRRALHKRGIPADKATVAVWGLAYKENTHSIKNSPSLALISSIPECRKQVYDPAVKMPAADLLCEQRGSALDCCQGADALVVPTPWAEFRQADLTAIRAAMSGRIILDPFGMLDGENAVALGFDYYRLGMPPRYAGARHNTP
jgi:UDPglucose 6-dehydrogenase